MSNDLVHVFPLHCMHYDAQHNNKKMRSSAQLDTECCYAQGHYSADCVFLFSCSMLTVVKLTVVMLSATVLSVVMLSVILLSFAAPN